MARRFIPATDAEGRPRYVNIDVIDIAAPSREGDSFVLRTTQGRVLGIARTQDFSPDDYTDD
jgi:hypothetical protein